MKASSNCDRQTFLKKAATGVVGSVFISSSMRADAIIGNEYPATEPTKEFLEMEARAAAFRKEQAEYKKVWDVSFNKFVEATTDDAAIAAMDELSKLVFTREQMPASVKKDVLLKTFRKKKNDFKAAGKWGTPTEIAYERMIGEIDRSLRPRNKDIENPL
eukprot:CAMPEP_0194581214 /NCGR_PEP_ID=MMETSP0292-20121207/14738_1 /TAXON_ID=39354 /ORGANISM="Heterosigma akashiwo, Strain CCMP2393" /LENGTH=159 /DNA_ID=CAMNT_0039434857 /DNA_START=88 /DNA_END=567 /DNA_ORIENTATION=-